MYVQIITYTELVASVFCTDNNKRMNKTKRPRGAPKKDQPADARFELRCTQDEKLKWEAAAEREGVKLAAWIKALANESAGKES